MFGLPPAEVQNLILIVTVVVLIVQVCIYRAIHKATLAVERAFVFVEEYTAAVVNDSIWVHAKWRNSGRTAALRRRSYASWKTFEGAPPGDWDWPDLDRFGTPTTTPHPEEGFLGPQATDFSVPLKINVAQMERVRAGTQRLFLWGWTEYDDVLARVVRHRTQFCIEMQVESMKQTGDGKATIAATFHQFGTRNQAN
jgi:hypothetical protein